MPTGGAQDPALKQLVGLPLLPLLAGSVATIQYRQQQQGSSQALYLLPDELEIRLFGKVKVPSLSPPSDLTVPRVV